MNMDKDTRQGLLEGFASKLRFPQLFFFTAIIFGIDLFVPDVIPFADEILLGLMTVLLANLKKKDSQQEERPMKNVTPPTD